MPDSKPNSHFRKLLWGCLILTFVFINASFFLDSYSLSKPNNTFPRSLENSQDYKNLMDLQNAFIRNAKKIKPSVVSVNKVKELFEKSSWYEMNPHDSLYIRAKTWLTTNLRGRKYVVEGVGSGIVLDSGGYILTNYHVIEKIDRICRKLELSESDTLLEIGTGWGSFSAYAAKNYGCSIVTTTISDAQYNYAESLFKKKGLDSKIKLISMDYRNLEGEYDKIVSIEMIEAVGYQYIPEYFKKINSLLKPNGKAAIQAITYNDQNFDNYKNSVDFIKKYIFPGSCLVSFAQVIDVLKVYTDMALVDMEDITLHYAETLKKWRENFIEVLPEVKKLGFSDSFIKMWEFYFVFCEAGFLERNIGDIQMILAKSNTRDIRINY